MRIEEQERKIKELQDFLGPRVNFTSDNIPEDPIDKELLDILDVLKKEHYKQLSNKGIPDRK